MTDNDSIYQDFEISTTIRGCSSLCCTNKTSVDATYCLVGALLALASGKAERGQVHPLQDTVASYGHKKRSPKSFDSEDLK